MAQYTIDNNRSINKNGRDNFSRGEKNSLVWSTSLFKRTYLTPNRIYYKYNQYSIADDRLWKKLRTSVRSESIKKPLTIRELTFGFPVLNYSLSFPPSLIRYEII